MAARLASLVSSSWLKQQLHSGHKNIKVLDASWTPLTSGKENYLSKHIPGAQFFDLNHCVEPEPTNPRNLPDQLCFADYTQSLGVKKDSHLIVYDRGGILASARTWWTFRAYGHPQVSVLDGGLNKWETDGNPVMSGEEQSTEKGDFKVDMNKSLIHNFNDMVDILKSKSNAQIVDARQPKHFSGEEAEPTGAIVKALQGMSQPVPDSLHRGHIPGAKNLLEDLVLNPETKCLLPKDELMLLFRNIGIDLSHPMVTMCYSGNAASLLALAAHVCGKEDTSVYYGSWTEWGQRASPDMVAGPSSQPGVQGG